MTQPNEPDPPDAPAGTNWYEAVDAVQRALDTIPPMSVSRWLPRGVGVHEAEIQADWAREQADHQITGAFQQTPARIGAAPAWNPYGGLSVEEHAIYAQMRANQAQGLPAITREEMQRQGIIPADELPPLPVDYQQQQDDVARLMAAGHSPEVLTERLMDMGFEPVGTVAADGVQIARRRNTEDVARVFGVPVELISGPTPDREGYAPGDGPSGDLLPTVGPGLRVTGYDREREMYSVEFVDDPSPAGDSNDPLTALRTRPVGQAHVRVTPTSRDRLLDSRRDTTFRERMLAPRTVAPLEIESTPPPPPAPSREPDWVDPARSIAAQRLMEATFADLENMGRGELLDLIALMRKDWETLNDIHNRRAARSGWCEEYEDRQSIHNTKLAALKLVGRVRGGPKDEYEGRGL